MKLYFVLAYHRVGQCKFHTGSIEEAMPRTEHAIRLSPRDPTIGNWYWWIGQMHLLQSRIEEAIIWFKRTCSANPALPFAHASLASAYALSGETGRAVAELAEARRLSSSNLHLIIAHLKAHASGATPKVRALYEATVFTGLRKAGWQG